VRFMKLYFSRFKSTYLIIQQLSAQSLKLNVGNAISIQWHTKALTSAEWIVSENASSKTLLLKMHNQEF